MQKANCQVLAKSYFIFVDVIINPLNYWSNPPN